MSDRIEELLAKAREAGVDDSLLSDIQSTFEASPLRQDLAATKDRLKEQADQARAYRSQLMQERFRGLGIGISPDALNIPEDLDPTDTDKVTTWATEMGLVQAKPTTPPEQLATHDRIAAASTGVTAPTTEALQRLLTLNDEEEFWAQAPALQESLHRNSK